MENVKLILISWIQCEDITLKINVGFIGTVRSHFELVNTHEQTPALTSFQQSSPISKLMQEQISLKTVLTVYSDLFMIITAN